MFGAPSYIACHCEEAVRRGNPFFWQLVLACTSCTEYRLPRPLRGLAMTDVVDGLHLSFDFLCHCEEAKPTRQSVLLAVCSCVYFLHGVRIAAAPAGPRNERRWTIVPLKSVPEGDTSILHSSFFILHFSTPPVDCGENPVHNRIWLSPSTDPCGKRLFYPHSPVDGNPLNLLASTGFST